MDLIGAPGSAVKGATPELKTVPMVGLGETFDLTLQHQSYFTPIKNNQWLAFYTKQILSINHVGRRWQIVLPDHQGFSWIMNITNNFASICLRRLLFHYSFIAT